jgi:hypothetical protein
MAVKPVSQVPLPYTAGQASRALPLVRRIVDDVVRHYADWQDAVSRFEYATSRSSVRTPDAEADRLQSQAQALATEIDGFVRELAQLGVECRDLAEGLVEFPGDTETFQWRPGEDDVTALPRTLAGT